MTRPKDEADKPGNDRSGPAMVDRLRDRIDRGGTADKVPFSDPSAAPLGTDAEAGGHPPTVEEVRRADRHEAPRGAAEEKHDVAERQPSGPTRGTIVVVCVLIAAVAVIVWAFAA